MISQSLEVTSNEGGEKKLLSFSEGCWSNVDTLTLSLGKHGGQLERSMELKFSLYCVIGYILSLMYLSVPSSVSRERERCIVE